LEETKGKVVVLEFWATWCGPCVAAIPHFNSLVDRFHDKPVVFISVTSEDERTVREFLKVRPIKGWLELDEGEALKNAFHVQGIPHTVIVDAGGKIAAITHPIMLEARHLEEVLNGQKCSLAEPTAFKTQSPAAEVVPAEPPPLFDISIRQCYPRKNGPMGNWTEAMDGSAFEGNEARSNHLSKRCLGRIGAEWSLKANCQKATTTLD
jgi:peroxiredoxin